MSEPVVGIPGIGVHVPRYRLSGETLDAVWGAGGSGTRAAASHDEDSLTMAVEAALAALGDSIGADLDLVCFASMTPPYAEKFEATEHMRSLDRSRGVAVQVGAGRPLRHYGRFLQFRRLVETEPVRASR